MARRFKMLALACLFCIGLVVGCKEKPTTVEGPKGKIKNPDAPGKEGGVTTGID